MTEPAPTPGRVALVTGAASGIGRASALRLARDGCAVACVDRDADGAAATARDVVADGGDAWPEVADVAVEAEVDAAVDGAVARGGRLDVLVNCAGIVFYRTLAATTAADVERLLAVNLLGTFSACRAAAPALVATRGAIVNIASAAGVNGRAYLAAYSASKGAVVALSRSLAVELAPEVRVNVVCPSAVDTPMVAQVALPPDADPGRLARHPMLIGRKATADEVAAAVAHLASPEAGATTGAVLLLDGGAAA
jgi:meso-butanediol dehydrogenase / (S,S)-butanediol dehydrogenase / diacetyl reductase